MKNDFPAAVLFSGGADSSLATLIALEHHRSIFLITFKNGYELFVRRSCLMAERIQEKYASHRVVHRIIDDSHIFSSILKNTFSGKRYLKSPGLLCCAERIAIYIYTVIFCLEKQVRYVYDGSNYQQGQIAFPQLPEVISITKDFFKCYNISYNNPIFKNTYLSEIVLLREGLIKKEELYQGKRLFFKDDSFLPLDIILGLWHKLKNKLHPIFFIETGLQFLGRITRFKKYSSSRKQKKIVETIDYFKEKLEFGKRYIESVENDEPLYLWPNKFHKEGWSNW